MGKTNGNGVTNLSGVFQGGSGRASNIVVSKIGVVSVVRISAKRPNQYNSETKTKKKINE